MGVKPTQESPPTTSHPAPYYRTSPRRTRLRRLLSYLVLISAALTLSTILPTPWSLLKRHNASRAVVDLVKGDPANEWQDNVYPLRQPTPWDISTDYAYPRKLDYDVDEGTWLRLDVHPTSGDIVFDMVGDLYCIPGGEALHPNSNGAATARPILQGIPYDSDPHFSPTGDRIVFRSDAELGVENIWVMQWDGCDVMDLKARSRVWKDMAAAREHQERDEDLLVQGVPEDLTRRERRLLREGRINAQRVTNETYHWVSDARFHPSGSKVIATKWYTSRRSLGTGEGWEYPVPSLKSLQTKAKHPINVGSGRRIISRSLPLGWTSDKYGEQQIGPEQLIWKGSDSIIFAKNIVDTSGRFTYSKDVHRGIYAIFQRNLTTESTETLVEALPGGANRPELSRDGKTLAFVRRINEKEALVLKDLETGSIHIIWDGLTHDLSIVSAVMGTYPSFAFTPRDDAVVIWATGQIYLVPLAFNERGERIGASTSPRPISFTAHIEKRLAKTRRDITDVVGYETRETQQVHSFKELRADSSGKHVVFQAGGLSYWQKLGAKVAEKVPVLDTESAYYSPSFVPFQNDLVIHARWSDSAYTTFELADLTGRKAYEFEGLPFGRYFSPILCERKGPSRTIAFLKTAGTYLTGDILATAHPGLYVGEVSLPDSTYANSQTIRIRNLRFVESEIDTIGRVNMRFIHTNKQLLVQQSQRAFVIDLNGKADQSGRLPHRRTLATGKMSRELAISPKLDKRGRWSADNVAFNDVFNIYVASGDHVDEGEAVWSRPGNATEGLVRLSSDGGHDATWTADGKTLLWFLGPYLHSLDVSKLEKCGLAIKNDPNTFGIGCVKSLVDSHMVVVDYETDIARLKKQAAATALSLGSAGNYSDHFLVSNATILTMNSDNETYDLIHEGSLLIAGGVIQRVGANTLFDDLPSGITTLNANGGFVIPGFIDVHGHWEGYSERYPAKSWEMETFLAYGITTLHNPSADNVDGFIERVRIESGQMIGPRIFNVGDIIFGGGQSHIHQDIVDMDQAKSALRRIKAEGGPASISYKIYNLPSRASRQRLLTVAQNMSMLGFPEGGENYDWDLTYILDGMTTIEHAIPVPTLYEDVMTLYALSGTGATPTHIVNYGGAWGEQLVWATNDIPHDPKLRRFTRHDILESITESTSRPDSSYALFNTSRSIAKMVDKGLLAHIGAHGEPPLGFNYHAEMGFTGKGGLSNYQVIRAATSSAAKSLGIFPSLGSLAPGKLADFLIYPPGVNLLDGEISERTLQIRYVARGGRIWDAQTMVEFWPVNGARQVMPILNAD